LPIFIDLISPPNSSSTFIEIRPLLRDSIGLASLKKFGSET
jgi:hypothetical protein